MKTTLIALALLGATVLAGWASVDETRKPPSLAVNWMRALARHPALPVEVEPSTRLAIPASVTEDVWSLLRAQSRRGPQVAQITDWYYDTPSGRLARQRLAVRLRTGHNRPRVQIKAYDVHTGHAAELTFDATSAEPGPLTSLIEESERQAFDDALALLAIDPHELRADAPLFHARRRIELKREGTEMTASLDHLTWNGGEHYILELTPEASESNHRGVITLTNELRAVFPAVRVDPAPKIIAVQQRSVARDDTTCVWSAARLMCRAAPPPDKTPVPFPVAPAAEAQAMPSTGYGLTRFPLSTGIGPPPVAPLGTGTIGTGRTGRLGRGYGIE